MFDSDEDSATVTYTVTFSPAATVAITIDDRLTDKTAADVITAQFAAPGTFQDTGLDLTIQESATTLRKMSVYAADLPAGTYVFSAYKHGGNFYTVGAIGK